MNLKNTSIFLLALILLSSCTTKPKTDVAKERTPAPVAADSTPPPQPVVVDPTPPPPPNSVEASTDIKDIPALMLLFMGGLATEGEKDGVEMQDAFRMFRTDEAAQDIISFYQKELKERGWTTDGQVARTRNTGVTIQQFQRASGTEALFVVIAEPEDAQSTDPAKSKRYVALFPAKVNKPKH